MPNAAWLSASATQILDLAPDGVVLGNGPGDPEPLTGVVAEIGRLLGRVPVLGICLGHQLLARAVGGRTYKLRFGHHGGNHPVLDRTTGRVEITSHNHGFCVDASTLDPGEAHVTHVNVNDDTLEGIELTNARAFSVQHHPEASPGPHDSMKSLFEKFVGLMADR